MGPIANEAVLSVRIAVRDPKGLALSELCPQAYDTAVDRETAGETVHCEASTDPRSTCTRSSNVVHTYMCAVAVVEEGLQSTTGTATGKGLLCTTGYAAGELGPINYPLRPLYGGGCGSLSQAPTLSLGIR
jgi:hypothetical protein